MRRLLMNRLIRIFTVCLVNLFFIPIIEPYTHTRWLSELCCMSEYTPLYPREVAVEEHINVMKIRPIH